MAKGVFEKMFASGRDADEIVGAEGLSQLDDEAQILEQIAAVLRDNTDGGEPVSRRQGLDLRLPGRPGHEGDGWKGQPEAGERAAETVS